MVHNLGLVQWNKFDVPGFGFDWALEMNNTFKELISNRQHQKLIDYHELGLSAKLAIPTPEHYLPLIYTLGLRSEKDHAEFFNDKALGGSLTMTSVKFDF